jgi:alpha-ketoglutarate-dependent taurine dioxygenase
MEMLKEITSYSKMCWDNTLEKSSGKFSVVLNEESLDELNSKKSNLSNENPNEFKFLNKYVKDLKNEILINGCGFFVINGKELSHFTVKEKKSIYLIISKIIGKLLQQNKDQQEIVEIKDLGKSMSTGGRYHQTKEGGSYHTDGSHIFQNPPDYVGLLCVNPAKKGGISKFMSAYTIHKKLLENKTLLRILYEKFHHDKKNENNETESLTRFEPIFQLINNELRFKYQRELIMTGHKKAKQPLTELQTQAIEFLEKTIDNPKQVVTYELKSGDMMFSNNRWLIHDRTSFVDFEDDSLKRLLLRTWIREEN